MIPSYFDILFSARVICCIQFIFSSMWSPKNFLGITCFIVTALMIIVGGSLRGILSLSCFVLAVFHDKVLNFHDWVLCYRESYHDNPKNQRKYQSIFISLKFKSLSTYLTWIIMNEYFLMKYSLFMNTLDIEFCWFRSYILHWYFPCCLKLRYKYFRIFFFLNCQKCKHVFLSID